jgi:hypothetical protein
VQLAEAGLESSRTGARVALPELTLPELTPPPAAGGAGERPVTAEGTG